MFDNNTFKSLHPYKYKTDSAEKFLVEHEIQELILLSRGLFSFISILDFYFF